MTSKEKEHYSFSLLLCGVLLLLTDMYYHTHPLLAEKGFTFTLLDELVLMIRKGGALSSSVWIKAASISLTGFGLATFSVKIREVSKSLVYSAGIAGLIMFFFPVSSPVIYFVTTTAGYGILCWCISCLSWRSATLQDVEYETFRQCGRLMNTEDSINLETRYVYRGRIMVGYINIIAPYRGIMVVGNQGSGKSYSVFDPCIEQMMSKGFTMFNYDFKFPAQTLKVYNELLKNIDRYPVRPEFCVIDFNRPTHSLRCNPLNPRYINDPADATEIAELIMQNANKGDNDKDDFFRNSAITIIASAIWYLRKYEDGRYCTFPHLIEFLSQDYRKLIPILQEDPEVSARMRPLSNAMTGNSPDQFQGQMASAQIPIGKFVSRTLYWTMSGDDIPLDINNPEHPIVLCVGNDPDRQMIYGTSIALIASRLFKSINRPGRLKCGLLLDEFPTVRLKGIDHLIATARSNRVAVVIGAQDKSQIRRDYGDRETDVVFNTVGNLIVGQVSGNTAEEMARAFGRDLRDRDSYTYSSDSQSVNTAKHETEIMPIRRIETLSQGMFFGKVSDTNSMKIDDKLFCGEVQRDVKRLLSEQENWKPVPEMTDFGRQETIDEVMSSPEKYMVEHCRGLLSKQYPDISETALEARAGEMARSFSLEERDSVLKEIIEKEYGKLVEKCLQDNFIRIQNEAKSIVEKASRPKDYDPFLGI